MNAHDYRPRVLRDARDVAQWAESQGELPAKRFRRLLDGLIGFCVCGVYLVTWKLNMFVEHAHEALEHLTTGPSDLALGHLGRKLPTKMALLIGNWVSVDLMEEFRLHMQRIGQNLFQMSRDRFCSCLDAAQILLGHTDLLSQVRE